jgi:hypothetical protein
MNEIENLNEEITIGTKRERKYNAKKLPTGITQDMMRKYVVYYEETYNKEKGLRRQYFKVEKHPKLGKAWMSSKSGKLSIKDKLQQANKIVDDLEKNIQPDEKSRFPLYFTLAKDKGRQSLVFDKRNTDGTRFNTRMLLPVEYDLNTQLFLFSQKIKDKYNIDIVF